MDKGQIISVLAAVIAVSISLNVALYYQNYTVNQQKNDFTAYYNEFGNVSIQSISYNFSPPVSMYRALKIALENGGWNTTSLENMTVKISLDYCKFEGNSSFSSFGCLSTVTHPVNDYSPVTVNETTYRYIWYIIVEENSVISIPPPGLYMVDAATAEIVPTGPLF